jgi:hypothetical protein
MTNGNIHNTQLSVTASLLNQGMEVDDVVRKVQEATKDLPKTDDWDWNREEKTIRKMCTDWLKKHPRAAAVDLPTELVIPVDLWGKFEPPPLPSGLLPALIEQYAIAQAEMMGCDAGGLAMSMLTVCAAVTSDQIELQMKRHDPYWKEQARIWTVLVGLPSTKKSPIMRQAARGLIYLDIELYRDYAEAMAQYEALPAEEKKMARPPRQKRLRIEDTTIEAAQVVLMHSPDGVLCLQDVPWTNTATAERPRIAVFGCSPSTAAITQSIASVAGRALSRIYRFACWVEFSPNRCANWSPMPMTMA